MPQRGNGKNPSERIRKIIPEAGVPGLEEPRYPEGGQPNQEEPGDSFPSAGPGETFQKSDKQNKGELGAVFSEGSGCLCPFPGEFAK